jgi:hypothetical protein
MNLPTDNQLILENIIQDNVDNISNKNKINKINTKSKIKQSKKPNGIILFDELCDNIYKSHSARMGLKQEKVTNETMIIPNFSQHDFLLINNYNVSQLKQINTAYKLKISGNKTDYVSKIYSYLFLSKYAVKIQKITRGFFVRACIKYRGPAFKKKYLCTNVTDFLTMDNISDLANEQFFSFRDIDGFIYGFDLLSINNLIPTQNGEVKNPYNRLIISAETIQNMNRLLRLSKLLKYDIELEVKQVEEEISVKKSVELRALTLFQNMDALGNYTNSKWFMDLNKQRLIRMLRELLDIWDYRAPLSMETKRAICPPIGNPFPNVVYFNQLNIMENIDDIRKYVLVILEKFVNYGIDRDNKCLGAYYVIGALTLVNPDAATSLPWLYQAFSYM